MVPALARPRESRLWHHDRPELVHALGGELLRPQLSTVTGDGVTTIWSDWLTVTVAVLVVDRPPASVIVAVRS